MGAASTGQLFEDIVAGLTDFIEAAATPLLVVTYLADPGSHGGGNESNDTIKEQGAKPGSTDGPGSGKRATPEQREKALQENGGKCVFCGKPATQADHSIPRSRGGDTTPQNLQPTCRSCNQQKGAKTSE